MFLIDRNQINELLNSAKMLHKELIVENDADRRKDYLAVCQQAAITVGETLEREQGEWPSLYKDASGIVTMLEDYCEKLFELSSEERITEAVATLCSDILTEVEKQVDRLPLRYRIVFFPYKASMWDSLESIYRAVDADERCDAVVCPIPYAEYDRAEDKWTERYEGLRFPRDINFTYYKQFDLDAEEIDVAYVHNPYDNMNLVTRIAEPFFSQNLKAKVGKLVYVPYYVNGINGLSENKKQLPVYQYADYIVLQSERAKEGCRDYFYFDKILPFGSPKFDRIIRDNNEDISAPEEWADVVRDRKTLLLNTTISELLQCDMRLIRKLDNIFSQMTAYPDIAVIWRPHPLLKSTIRAMRPHLLKAYEKLEEKFLSLDIGVIDKTSDASRVIAFSDGYIGSAGSSLVMLYEVTGKPIFLFNIRMERSATKEEHENFKTFSACTIGDTVYVSSNEINGLFRFSVNEEEPRLQFASRLKGEVWWGYCPGMIGDGKGKVFFPPLKGRDAFVYLSDTENTHRIDTETLKTKAAYHWMGCAEDVCFCMPSMSANPVLLEYSLSRERWRVHKDCMGELWRGTAFPQNRTSVTQGWAAWRNRFYCTTGENNRVLMITAGTGRYRIFTVGDTTRKIVLRGANVDGLWMTDCAESETTIIMVPWNAFQNEKKWVQYPIPVDVHFTHNPNNAWGPYWEFYFMRQYLVAVPASMEYMVRINLDTGEVKHIADAFFANSFRAGLDFDVSIEGMVCRSYCQINDRLLFVQRSVDLKCAIIDVVNDEVREFNLTLPETGEFAEAMVAIDAGFERGDRAGEYCMKESRLFPIQHFLKGFSEHGYRSLKERQIEAMSSLAANLDGTCGQKVHEYMVSVLTKKQE